MIWEGSVNEPESLSQRIQECEKKCDEEISCKFMFVNTVNDWCRIHSNCNTLSTLNIAGLTFAKRGNASAHHNSLISFNIKI